jgi:hypothetical protein
VGIVFDGAVDVSTTIVVDLSPAEWADDDDVKDKGGPHVHGAARNHVSVNDQ